MDQNSRLARWKLSSGGDFILLVEGKASDFAQVVTGAKTPSAVEEYALVLFGWE